MFWWFHKIVGGMQLAVLAAKSMGVMHPAALAACIIYKYVLATEQHFAWGQNGGVQSVVICYTRIFM
jgi:hypothetical protein